MWCIVYQRGEKSIPRVMAVFRSEVIAQEEAAWIACIGSCKKLSKDMMYCVDEEMSWQADKERYKLRTERLWVVESENFRG